MTDINCKRCSSGNCVKNGTVRGKARWLCKDCRYNFVIGDGRVHADLVAKKALAVIMYSVCKSSYGMLGRLFGVSRSLTYRWIREAADQLPEPTVPGSIQEMEFDEMWHFIGSKKTKYGSSKRWIVAQGEPWPGSLVVVMLQLPQASFERFLYGSMPFQRCYLQSGISLIGIEQDNSNTRHCLMTRRTKVVSKSEYMDYQAVACYDRSREISNAISIYLWVNTLIIISTQIVNEVCMLC